jgi:hypothetical protein
VVVEHSPVQEHLGEAREVGRRPEEPGVRGDASERIGVLVVDLANHHPPAPRVQFRRGDPRKERGRGVISGVLHAERFEYPFQSKALQRLPRHPLQHLAEQHHPKVAVDRLRARLVREIHRDDPLEVRRLRLQLLVERRPPVDPRRVREELRDRHLLLPAALEPRDEVRDLLPEVELAFVDEDHRHRRGQDHLGQAREVVDGGSARFGRAGFV